MKKRYEDLTFSDDFLFCKILEQEPELCKKHHLMERGKSYNELNRSYIIFICRFNLFPQIGRHKYTFANLCREDTAIELGDETEKIFLCTRGILMISPKP